MDQLDHRVVIAIAAGLVLAAAGGFYFALKPSSPDAVVTAARQPQPAGTPPAKSEAATPEPVKPQPATRESIEAEIGRSDHAELQVLLKRSFPDEYDELIAAAVQRRNAGATDAEVGQETFARFQNILRTNLKFAVGASTASIDRLAANEIRLFDALSAAGGDHCLSVLGKADNQAGRVPPDEIRQLMRLATLHRFEAIVEGRLQMVPVEALTPDELKAFEASLRDAGLTLDEVRSGAFLTKEGDEPGKPCRMVGRLYTAVSRLDESPRRKLYSSMFFLGRDR
jgi:hypothetical protein